MAGVAANVAASTVILARTSGGGQLEFTSVGAGGDIRLPS
jgi:hypothetical protein